MDSVVCLDVKFLSQIEDCRTGAFGCIQNH